MSPILSLAADFDQRAAALEAVANRRDVTFGVIKKAAEQAAVWRSAAALARKTEEESRDGT